jgi:cell wall assembly regulator SMI1
VGKVPDSPGAGQRANPPGAVRLAAHTIRGVDPVEELRRAQSTELVDEDGHEVVFALEPGLPPEEIDRLEAETGFALPRELRALLEHTAGVDGALESIDFTGQRLDFELADALPRGLPIAHDGFGNFWVLDVVPGEPDAAPVFFACHDAPVLLYQAPDLAHFLHETVRMFVPPHASLIDDVHEDRLHDVWRSNPGVLDHAAALAGDASLREFAAGLDERFRFVDLREPAIGMGFSWGRHGPRTEVRRHGFERLFAYAAPPKRRLRERLFR